MVRYLIILLVSILVLNFSFKTYGEEIDSLLPKDFREHISLILTNKKIYNTLLNGDTAIFINIGTFLNLFDFKYSTFRNTKMFFWNNESLFFYGVNKYLRLIELKCYTDITIYEFMTFSNGKEFYINCVLWNKTIKSHYTVGIVDMKISKIKTIFYPH